MRIAIIGAGASGLAAAALLSREGIRSTVFEKNSRVGKKLLVTGNGRCNLGNTNLDLSKYHGDTDLAQEVFSDWRISGGAQAFFREFGLICRTDSEGRLYPHSNSATSVLDTLRRACTHTEFITDHDCREFPRAQIVIIAVGNQISAIRHLLPEIPFVEPFPSLAPIITDPRLTRPLKGLRVKAQCRAVVNEQVIKSEIGEVQFNDGSLSGICIMNLSRLVHGYNRNLNISLDIAHLFTKDDVMNIPLSGLFHSRIVEVLEKSGANPKDWRFPVTGVATMDKAQVMAGGVPAIALDSDLSVKKCPQNIEKMYILGEAINVDGDCGGYNLEWAWATADRVCKNISRTFRGNA
jgi:hypothetical protein